jgi:2-amino-4-hydroxy-6-hydroxymethyldihydropteridine diphosphokinase
MKRVYLALGSNLGDRRANIETALEKLAESGVKVQRVSSLYRTEPIGYTAQPWFVNCAAEVMTDLMPVQLVRRCQAIQREMGRRPGARNGPRLIDIDILLYESVVMRSPEVTIPHPRMAERRFVLVPLGEIAADAEHPVTRQTVREMLGSAPPAAVVKLAGQLSVVSRQLLVDR